MGPTAPAFPVLDASCRVLDSAPVGRRYHRIELQAPPGMAAARPGQFFHILCADTGSLPFLRRPMSVWRSGGGRIGFLFKMAGRGTAALARLRPGAALTVLGPLGHGFTLPAGARRILILARGVGFATLAPLAAAAAGCGIAVEAVLSARSAEDLMLTEFAGSSGAVLHAVLDADGSSDPDAVEALLRRRFAAARPDAVFTCGSNRLLLLLQRVAAEFGIGGEAALEQQMGCGLGMCFCCVRPIRQPDGTLEHLRVCAEGPVFDLQAALPS